MEAAQQLLQWMVLEEHPLAQRLMPRQPLTPSLPSASPLSDGSCTAAVVIKGRSASGKNTPWRSASSPDLSACLNLTYGS